MIVYKDKYTNKISSKHHFYVLLAMQLDTIIAHTPYQ